MPISPIAITRGWRASAVRICSASADQSRARCGWMPTVARTLAERSASPTLSRLDARSPPQEITRVTPAATARSMTASMSEPKRVSSRCACASITRARLGGDALETREQRGARLHRITRLQHTPLRDILPSRLLRMHDAEELADLRADVRRVGIE